MDSIIDQDALREMCDKIDLLEYAQQTMEFHRRGDKYFTSCPLHSDSDPSLCISPEDNLWYCFSCKKGGNIINWIMVYEKLTFQQTVSKISAITGTELHSLKICDSLKYFKELKRIAEEKIRKRVERKILPESYYENNFAQEIPDEWVDEGISPEVMREYNIRIDKASNRICYPIYDNDGNLIGVKGRTRFKNFKELNIKKYNNYTSIVTTDFFVGMKQNKQAIQKAGSVIVFEGIKSGLKLCSWGLGNNWLSAETSRLNEAQVKILLGMHVPEVTIAFDRDVDKTQIASCAKILSRFCNVYVVRDRYNKMRLLPGDKDSPVDAGKEVWEQLYKERVRI